MANAETRLAGLERRMFEIEAKVERRMAEVEQNTSDIRVLVQESDAIGQKVADQIGDLQDGLRLAQWDINPLGYNYRQFQDLRKRVTELEGKLEGRTEAPNSALGGYQPGKRSRNELHLALPTPPLPHG